MRTKTIAAAALFSAAILSWTAPAVFAGHGGHGGGGFSGGNVSHGGSRGYSGVSYGYSGGLRGYTGGGLGRVYSSYAPRYSSTHWNRYRTYSAPSNVYRGAANGYYSSPSASGHRFNRNQPGINRSKGVANISDNRIAFANRSMKVGTTSLSNTTRDGVTRPGTWARENPVNKNRFDQRTQNRLRNWQGNKSSWADAKHNHNEWCHHRLHDHDWWHHHCDTIIWVDWGWWGWWDGWWYPAWGYDPYYSYYAYDGPIYGYDGLPPDEVVANVQSELQRCGYYYDAVDGILGPRTQEALIRYQRDHGLPVTGGIDQETVGALGLG